ncbi:MAG TPA: NAD(P)H-quinone oxidoreductase [Bacillales bacterium]|nr:NAD(P)H-quinone oxidoreductase [Bacillales bacterium]
MQAVLVEEESRRLYIGEHEKPAHGDQELLVKVKATALNRADLLQRQGGYPPPEGASPILGLEMAGIVEEVGSDVDGWMPGDRVFGLLPGGGYAEYAAIPAGMAMRVPENLSLEEAAAIPEVFLTAYMNLFWLGGMKAGHTVLIHAGASGVGTAATQLVYEAGGTSITTAGTDEKRAFSRELGASTSIDYKAGPFEPRVREKTDGRGVDIILDFIGAPYWEQNLKSLAVDGRLVIIGTMGGTKIDGLNLGQLLRRRLQVIGTALRSQPGEKKIELTREFAEFALPRFEDGCLKPIVDSVWNWQDANDAQQHMMDNKNTGKIVLRIGEE